uniref:EGF-like domain-containing protein n=1 Tax=Panagrellus redivivus TaxID=6233 RepID=A0A7E4VBL3_PANRE
MKAYLIFLIFYIFAYLSLAYECPTCNPYGYCWDFDNSGNCTRCICPNGFGGDCCDQTPSDNPCDNNPCTSTTEHCNNHGNGLYTCDCNAGYTGAYCDTLITACDSYPCANNGVCTPIGTSSFTCTCSAYFTGTLCESSTSCHPVAYGACACRYYPCYNYGTCVQKTVSTYSCICAPGYTGTACQTAVTTTTTPDPCTSLTCYNGGACVTNSAGTPSCLCLNTWKGTQCELFDNCQVDQPCKNGGTCVATGNRTHTCTCTCEYTGDNCEDQIDYCNPQPCFWTGTCSNANCSYTCDCPSPSYGNRCQYKNNNCYYGGLGVCNSVDTTAVCTDLLEGFSCACSPLYTGDTCTMSIYVWKALEAFGTTDIIPLLEGVVKQPSLISSIIPFVLGQLDTDAQSAMSWTYEDLFLWAAFEKTELTKADIIQSFDITLGNCFSFNHANSTNHYYLRTAGKPGGFEALLRVRQDEYPAWIDTAALLIFPHAQSSIIFSESTRFNAAPSKSTTVITNQVAYNLLGGFYGKCVTKNSQVNSYYYTGSYTSSGCLRACYQDAVNDACGCMDPRYAMPEGVSSCSLDAWDCVNNLTTIRGDASGWSDCICPSPCNDLQYESSYALNTFVYYTAQCNYSSSGACYTTFYDAASISVYVPSKTHKVYAEKPAMSFNQLLNSIGGMGGVFLGISIITFIEIAMLIIVLCRAFVFKDIKTMNKAAEEE